MTLRSTRVLSLLTAGMLVAVACGGGGGGTPASSQPAAATGTSQPTGVAAINPTRPVEFVISTAPGGGAAIYARFMQRGIEKPRLSPQPGQPGNKEGPAGAGAVPY